MKYILNIETSTTNCSVALAKDGETVCIKEDNSLKYSHAERLHVYIDEVLKIANIQTSELAAVAVSKGPGSYTGLRIGVSAAKGLCFALDIPLISVPTLEALAYKIQIKKGCIVAMLDARRMEVYASTFDSDYSCIEPTDAKILDENSYGNILQNQSVHFVGTGVDKTKTIIQHPNAYFDSQLPSAKQMCRLSFNKFQAEEFEDLAYFEPFYLKDFIAIPSKKN
ncbi:MAG: tRNA (adenosine(37)-N6)-threonylcarbamoyltransferase complex dimerization subunit type 1 TsaB [Bacteroidetes bacterium]|nr:tRNA (adenosine(37)-N6)-threonylcarbamoyltransferase complex dimerization subunit type 1 TsaB [Bacteroidota bacterium]MDA0860173.1 tRNA (adenosine(37)-N6)-threonylcarbamoyltransferase complex dimerization subunit type 1 TsaB [Bacteroidota bacterium]MDA1319025.1 tRNA (adenosine(37)-N6)-threonylcarbamoyltransferase complex dimerization subunit type 1 TsaB [Bacteroidota bacterium]